MMKFLKPLLVTIMFILSACASVATESATPVPEVTAPSSGEAVELEAEAQKLIRLAQEDLAHRLNIATDVVRLESIHSPAEPGGTYIIRLEANREVYEYHGNDNTITMVSDPLPPAPATSEASPEASAGYEDLVDTRWRLVSMGVHGAETSVIEGSTITLEFRADGQAGGTGGCNSYGGEYQVQADSLSFNEVISTMMACADQNVTEQEQHYFQALQTAGQFALTDDQLTITYDGGQGILNFADASASADAPGRADPGLTQAARVPSEFTTGQIFMREGRK